MTKVIHIPIVLETLETSEHNNCNGTETETVENNCDGGNKDMGLREQMRENNANLDDNGVRRVTFKHHIHLIKIGQWTILCNISLLN